MGGVLIAIYSLNIKIQSRGKGKSAIAAAAYIAGERFKNEYDGIIHDRTDRKDVVHSEIVLPENAPAEFYDRAVLWNAVELSERAKNAQLAREIRLALPKDFTLEQNINLVHQYANENFVSRGMCADIAIHDKKDDNVHAHVLLTMRPLERDGTFGAKSRMEYILAAHGEKIKLPSGRYKTRKISTTDWDNRDNAELWREKWADTLNMYLQHYKHETRVDHRSFERQGLEILPTIHLGAVSHALEKQGIRTERGDINRAIKKKNAQLQLLDKKIHEIQNPPRPQFLIDIENSIKAKNSPGYEHWCRIFNIQQMAKTLLYIQQNGYEDMNALQSAHQNAANDISNLQTQLDETKDELTALRKQKDATETYRRTVDIWKKYNNTTWFFNSSKEKFYEENKSDIEAYKSARAYIYDELKLEKFPSLKKLSVNISTLTAEQKELQKALPAARKKAKSLKVVTHNAKMLLGYKDLELQDNSLQIATQNPRNIPILKKNFDTAKKEGVLSAYFQNRRANSDCASFIDATIEKWKVGEGEYALEEAAKEIIAEFGKERTEWVVAAFVNDAPDNKYTAHKKWASQKNKSSEPQNIPIQSHPVIIDKFVERFIEVSNRKRSFAESIEYAKQKMQDQEESRVSALFHRLNRNSGHSLD